LKLRIFQLVKQRLEVRGGEISRKDVVAELRQFLPAEDADRIFETLVAWGRFGEMFVYREEERVLTLQGAATAG
jgi:NitT/TauT family transport system ATP-binding protein